MKKIILAVAFGISTLVLGGPAMADVGAGLVGNTVTLTAADGTVTKIFYPDSSNIVVKAGDGAETAGSWRVADQTICTQSCIPGVGDSCPDGFTCIQSGVGQGVCFFPADEGGCCSAGGDGQTAWVQPLLGLGLLGLIVLRPRRRRR